MKYHCLLEYQSPAGPAFFVLFLFFSFFLNGHWTAFFMIGWNDRWTRISLRALISHQYSFYNPGMVVKTNFSFLVNKTTLDDKNSLNLSHRFQSLCISSYVLMMDVLTMSNAPNTNLKQCPKTRIDTWLNPPLQWRT